MKKIRSKTARLPVADAGKDQTVYARFDRTASVTLDGSGSSAPKASSLTYAWHRDGTPVATGSGPTVELPGGEHTITLVVNDGRRDSEPSKVVITVIEPMEAECRMFPPNKNLHKRKPEIMAMLRLPPDITKDEINLDQPLRLYPGGAELVDQYAMQWRARRRLRTNIFAFFHEDLLKHAASHDGCVLLSVVGRLKSGRYFCGSDTLDVGDRSETTISAAETSRPMVRGGSG